MIPAGGVAWDRAPAGGRKQDAWAARPTAGHPIGATKRMRHGHHREAGHAPSQRQLRVGELIRHAVSELLIRGEIADPALAGPLITVPEVRVSADLRLATIYVVALGGRDSAEAVAALERNKRFLRGEIARRINLKFAPDIRFRIDDRFEEAERIEKLLRSPAVKRNLAGDADDER
jgi:ribosome-binding factor A